MATAMPRQCERKGANSSQVLSMRPQADARFSAALSLAGLVACFAVALLFGDAIAATKPGTIAGGLVGAAGFFNALHLVTSLEANARIRPQAGAIEGARRQ